MTRAVARRFLELANLYTCVIFDARFLAIFIASCSIIAPFQDLYPYSPGPSLMFIILIHLFDAVYSGAIRGMEIISPYRSCLTVTTSPSELHREPPSRSLSFDNVTF